MENLKKEINYKKELNENYKTKNANPKLKETCQMGSVVEWT